MIPFHLQSLDAQGVADLLGYSKSHFMQRIACLPGTPKRCNPGATHPRWIAGEWMDWRAEQQQRRAG